MCFNLAVSGVESAAAQAVRVAAGMLTEPGSPAPRLVWLFEATDDRLSFLAGDGTHEPFELKPGGRSFRNELV